MQSFDEAADIGCLLELEDFKSVFEHSFWLILVTFGADGVNVLAIVAKWASRHVSLNQWRIGRKQFNPVIKLVLTFGADLLLLR